MDSRGLVPSAAHFGPRVGVGVPKQVVDGARRAHSHFECNDTLGIEETRVGGGRRGCETGLGQ